MSLLLAGLLPSTGHAAAPVTSESSEFTVGSYEVAPVRILNIPVFVVASPETPGDGKGKVVEASQRARLIENTLRLLYAPPNFCRPSETVAENLLEGLILKGPSAQRVCSGDSWAVVKDPNALEVRLRPQPDGSVLLEALLPDRPVPLPLVTVTAADAALQGQTPERLAITWQEVLQRRLRHARRTMKAAALGLRLRVALLLELVLLLLPLKIMLWAGGIWLLMLLARLLLRFSLGQWGSNPLVAPELQRRREQRRRNLQQAGERLIRLIGGLALLLAALATLPGITPFTPGPWLAGGALLGALALVFQSLLRDFVAGLITLFDDHDAVGDFVDIDGFSGDVEDIGVVATVLRCLDQRVVVIPNSRCDRLVNHTQLRSGVEMILPLSPANPRLELALQLLREECAAFAAEPAWRERLLAALMCAACSGSRRWRWN